MMMMMTHITKYQNIVLRIMFCVLFRCSFNSLLFYADEDSLLERKLLKNAALVLSVELSNLQSIYTKFNT